MGRDIAFNLGRGIDNTQFTSRGVPPTASATFTHATTNNATNHSNVTRNASISSEQLRGLVPPHFDVRGDYSLVKVLSVPNGEQVGCRKPFNKDEIEALYGHRGAITENMPLATIWHDRRPKPDEQKTQSIAGCKFEIPRDIKCGANGCPCRGKIMRVKIGEATGLLYYEKMDPSTKVPLHHENHSRFPSEYSTNVKKATDVSLSKQQKEAAVKWCRSNGTDKQSLYTLALEMVDSNDIRTSDEQENDISRFAAKLEECVDNSRRSKSDFSHFNIKLISDNTTNDELLAVLEHLQSDKDSDLRNQDFASHHIEFMKSAEFRLMNQWIKVTDHDHNGTTWSYILFEYLYADELAKEAVQMYEDLLRQLEMDFFMGVSYKNQWQSGHIGLSDAVRKYWILAAIIAKSENHNAAKKLLDRAVELLRKAGGDASKVLVDGGKALAKAIGMQREENTQDLRVQIEQMRQLADEEDERDGIEPTHPESEAPDEPVFSDCLDSLFEAAVEAFVGQENDELGDTLGFQAVEARARALLESCNLKKETCHSHLTRQAGSRGGGHRGGRGSLCRCLLNHGCSKKQMKKILGLVFMMSKIPCGCLEDFRSAVKLLLEEFDKLLKPYVKKTYFSGDPSDLGSHCSKRPGENMSTNGAESRGGEVKGALAEILKKFESPRDSSNPLFLMSAYSRDAATHLRKSEPLNTLAVHPVRGEEIMEPALDHLRHLSCYEPPPKVSSSSRKKQKIRNMRADWLFSTVTAGGEVAPHEEALGEASTSVDIWTPTSSRFLTSLSSLMKKNKEDLEGATGDVASSSPSDSSLKDPKKLFAAATTLPLDGRKELKRMLEARRQADTPTPFAGESTAQFLMRRSQRNPHPDAINLSSKELEQKMQKTFGQLAEETLELEKEAVEEGSKVEERAGEEKKETKKPASRRSKRKACKSTFRSKEVQIDGEGGVLEAALEERESSAAGSHPSSCCEKLKDRVILKRELGDWIKTSYSSGKICRHGKQCASCSEEHCRRSCISCNCETYSVCGDCKHCVFMEVLHLKWYPKGLAKEQWPIMRDKMIHNLKVHCGELIK